MIRLHTFLFVVALASCFQFLSGNVPLPSTPMLRLATLAVLLAWPLAWADRAGRRALLGWPGLFVMFGLAVLLNGEDLRSAYAAGLLLLCALPRLLPSQRGLLSGLAAGAALYLCLWLSYLAMPQLQLALSLVAERLDAAQGLAFGRKALQLGAGAQGFFVAGLLLCLAVGRFLVMERDLRRLGWTTLAVGAGLLTSWVLERFAPELALGRSGINWLPGGIHLLCVACAGWTLSAIPSSTLAPNSERPSTRRPRARLTVACVTLSMLLLCLSLLALPSDAPRVLFADRGEAAILDWSRPSYDNLSGDRFGMFGLMPHHLVAHGFEVERSSAAFSDELLRDVDVLVVINANATWQATELEACAHFVEQGGSLVVLGDHTNAGGLQVSLNELLQPYGIAFRFDSALPPNAVGWAGADRTLSALLATTSSTNALNIGVGASLELSQRATPLITARFAVGDLGNLAATDKAYLGDYTYQQGERSGGLVLAAEAMAGEGRVVVFGDTSGFQNVSLPTTYDTFVGPLFRALSGEPLIGGLALRKMAALGVLLGTLWLAWSCASSGPLVAAAFLLSLVVSGYERGQAQLLAAPTGVAPTAWLDTAHSPRMDSAGGGKNCIYGLVLNLDRLGFVVRELDTFDVERMAPHDLLVSLAPVDALSESETEELMGFMKSGGRVLAAAGYPHREGLAPLLASAGLEVGDSPIGPIPLMKPEGRQRREVEYVEAWPLERMQGNWFDKPENLQVMGAFQGRPLSVTARIGKGGFFYVADSRFFSAENLEMLKDISLPNVQFLRDVVTSLGTGAQS